MMYSRIKSWYRSMSDQFPIKPAEGSNAGYVLSEGRESSPRNRIVWVIDRHRHRPIAVVFDAKEKSDPMVVSMTLSLDRKLFKDEYKKRFGRK